MFGLSRYTGHQNGKWELNVHYVVLGIFPFHYIEEQLTSCKRVLDPVYSITFPEFYVAVTVEIGNIETYLLFNFSF